MRHGAARGNSVLQRDADAVEEAEGADEAVAAAIALGRDAEVGDGFRCGRDAATVAVATGIGLSANR